MMKTVFLGTWVLLIANSIASAQSKTPYLDMGLEFAGRFSQVSPDDGIARAFSMPRTRAAFMADDGQHLSGRLILAAVRSTPETGYIGIDGEALVARIDVAEGRVKWTDWGISIGAGLINNPWVDRRNDQWTWQAIKQTATEQFSLLPRSDLGAEFKWDFKKELLTIWIQSTSGEGLRYRERNEGQSTIAAIRFRPLKLLKSLWANRLEISGFGVEGSSGSASARNHRFGMRVAGGVDRVKAGIEWTRGLGIDGDPVPELNILSVWTSFNPWGPIIGYARTDVSKMTIRGHSSQTHSSDVGLGIRIPSTSTTSANQARLTIGYRFDGYDDQATPIAGAQAQDATHTIMAQLTLDLGIRLRGSRQDEK